MFTKKLGRRGEKAGARFLKRLGYRILAANYQSPAGEIDLVAADGDTLVFVEVKTRRSDAAAEPENSVNFHKRCQVTRAARYFITHQNAQHLPCRFDVLSILMPDSGQVQVEHFIDAFPPTPR